eukprot:3434491-Prymnesium_polylepis.1
MKCPTVSSFQFPVSSFHLAAYFAKGLTSFVWKLNKSSRELWEIARGPRELPVALGTLWGV